MIYDDEERFRWEFTCQLRKLDPDAIIRQLHPDAILLCWEPRETIYPFKPLICHRQLVAKWLEPIVGYEVKELE